MVANGDVHTVAADEAVATAASGVLDTEGALPCPASSKEPDSQRFAGSRARRAARKTLLDGKGGGGGDGGALAIFVLPCGHATRARCGRGSPVKALRSCDGPHECRSASDLVLSRALARCELVRASIHARPPHK